MQTVKVMDARPLTGDAAASPRVVAALPFTDAGDTSSFHDDYALYAGAPPAVSAAAVCWRAALTSPASHPTPHHPLHLGAPPSGHRRARRRLLVHPSSRRGGGHQHLRLDV